MANKLDRSKPFGSIRGDGAVDGFIGVRFIQDGVYFDGTGNPARKAVKANVRVAAKTDPDPDVESDVVADAAVKAPVKRRLVKAPSKAAKDVVADAEAEALEGLTDSVAE